jgi:predicted Rossmann fold nucleotide-binding protein DprA/Smf involved in DNA uptake
MVLTKLSQEAVHPDTKAVLLLCGTFAKERGAEVKPLTLTEYNAVASWLGRNGRRPADLLETSGEPFPADDPQLPRGERIRALLDRGFQMATALEGWQRLGLWVISRGEDRYPERLRHNLGSAAPPLLYGAGDISRLMAGGLAVVGSRDIDEEGVSFARRVAERCASQDVPIISGGARGVDREAVAAALDASGRAIVVLADRLDRTATSRDAKEYLRRGFLTLVSPYVPESSFTVGTAMGRNKHIYALADNALVVRFTTREGGTWAGAVEQLGRNKSGSPCVPVFVRVQHNAEDGSKELQDKGALPFPEEDFWKDNVVELLSRFASLPERGEVSPACDSAVMSPATDERPAVSVEQAAGAEMIGPSSASTTPPAPAQEVSTFAEAETCYTRCLPLLLQHLQQEVGGVELSQIAKQLELQLPQLKKWLKRAVKEGKVREKKKKRRVVFVDASLTNEQTLFDRGGDAA